MNERELRERFPNATASFIAANSEVPDAKPKRHSPSALASVASGEKASLSRITLSFTGYRVKPLDPDNFAGSVKDLIDGLRAANLIAGDEWWRIRLQTEQVKVAHFADERTEIEITYPTLTTPPNTK